MAKSFKKINILQRDQLEKLTTPRLLAYKKSLLSAPDEPNWDESESARLSKDSVDYERAHKDVTKVLRTRENVE